MGLRQIGKRKQLNAPPLIGTSPAQRFALKTALLQWLLWLSLFPCSVFSSQFAAGDQVINTGEVTLDLVHNGKKAGSTKIPPGRKLNVVETSNDRVKVSAPPMLSGWVEQAALKLSTVAALKTAAANSDEVPESPTPPVDIPPVTRAAEPALAETSRIVVEETKSTEKIVAEAPGKCRGNEHHFSYQPKVARGKDLDGDSAMLRFYLVELRENKEKTKSSGATRRVRVDGESFDMPKSFYEPAVRQVKESPLPGDDMGLAPIKQKYMEWECSCCRDLRRGEILGWYAEVSDGEKVICKAQSSMNQKALAALQEHLARTER